MSKQPVDHDDDATVSVHWSNDERDENGNVSEEVFHAAELAPPTAVVDTSKSSAQSTSKQSKKSNMKELPEIPSFKIVPATANPCGILVDGFKFKRASHELYFLSHFHSDHYVGLTKTFDFGRVYCSPITANLVRLRIGTSAAIVKPIPLNTPFMIEDTGVQVTLFEANHCPGAVLFLFRAPTGKTYLHTGDFRYEPSMLRHFKEVRVDSLYLDTTFLHPQFTFPPQREAVEYIANKVKNIIAAGGTGATTLFLVGSYTIGKERILEEIVRVLPDERVYVSMQKLELWRLCELSAALMSRVTTQPTEARVHVVPMGLLRFDRMHSILRAFGKYTHMVAFHPTGWAFSGGRAGKAPLKSGAGDLKEERRMNMTRILVPYSEHSSFTELIEFCRALAPSEIIPTVDCETPAKVAHQLRILREHINRDPNRSTLVPFLKKGVSTVASTTSSTPIKLAAAASKGKQSDAVAAAEEPDFATAVMSASMFNWLANSQLPAQTQADDEELEARADDALSESDEDLGEFGHSGAIMGNNNVDDANDDDDNVVVLGAASTTTNASTSTKSTVGVNLSDESFLLQLYPALVDSPTPSQTVNMDEARGLLRSASKADPMLAEKLVSEQKWLMQQFERQKEQQQKAAKRANESASNAKRSRSRRK